MNMVSPLSRLDGGISLADNNPYKDLMDRMKEARDDEEREEREGEGGGRRLESGGSGPHPPFNILSPHMLNMMDRMKERGGGEAEDNSPMNLTSSGSGDKEDKSRPSEGR